ncbi:AraC family transcriptional regulator [Croceicoccus sediminis]|uniref:AraC family transcriptional regulator n=1 Tax=Croceicoccus sediminis TaxID=2571150 RepID=UPI001478E1D4|nr:AraC family transcriptional regulator [Croceicoccus sediminis]
MRVTHMQCTHHQGFDWYRGLPAGFEQKTSFTDDRRRSVSWFLHRLPERTETMSDHSDDPVISLEIDADGTIEREIDGKWQHAKLRDDTLTLTPAGAPCNWHWMGKPLDIVDVYLPKELLQSTWYEMHRARGSEINLSPLLQLKDTGLSFLLRSLVASGNSAHTHSALLRETLTNHIIVYVLGLSGAILRADPVPTSQLSLPQTRRVQEFVEARMDRNISLDDLAEIAGVSKSHFLRLFRNRTGQTPYAYLTERRLQHAADLLAQSGLPIGEISARCGFNSQAHFAQVFRARHGITPREYRKLMLN